MQQTILIIDDAVTNIEILASILGKEYEVLFASSGKEGLEIALTELPDLILLDIVMPDINGLEVCSRLKSEERTENIPVIFITTLNQELDEAKGLEVGAIDYITKPISPAIVRARVHNHLELKRYHDLLERQSYIDGLTGIANRRRLDEYFEQEWRRSQRTNKSISTIMADIDFFKLFNDTYGHLAGDDCLRKVARALANTVRRPADLVARYGGEEFCCVLPETDPLGASFLANRLREAVEFLDIPHQYSSIADHVTISLGVASTIPGRSARMNDLLNQADELLYEAKRKGRNRVVCSE